jgi:hypothetical protein
VLKTHNQETAEIQVAATMPITNTVAAISATDSTSEAWCGQMLPSIASGKPVYAAQYTGNGITLDRFCSDTKSLKVNPILKHRELGVYREAC